MTWPGMGLEHGNGKVPLLTAPVGAIFSMERSTSRKSQQNIPFTVEFSLDNEYVFGSFGK